MRGLTPSCTLLAITLACLIGCAEENETGGVPCPDGNCSGTEPFSPDGESSDSLDGAEDTDAADALPSDPDGSASANDGEAGTFDAEVEESESDTQEEQVDSSSEEDAESNPVDVVDVDGPEIVSMSPEAGEANVLLPVEVVIVFNEPIREETVDSNTFRLLNLSGKSISGTPILSEDQTTVTLVPNENTVAHASPYQIAISAFVQDSLGNAIGEDLTFTFYTGAPQNLGTYTTLAQQYAPLVRQSVRTGRPVYPTELHLDGDWNAGNNVDAIKSATEVKPVVYWDAVETRSHLFLYYFFYYPTKEAPGEIANPVASDLTGAVVTLFSGDPEAEPSPVSVLTYGANGGVEDMRVYRVEGSELGLGNLVDETASWEELSEDDRFLAWITQPLHTTCSWAIAGDGDCELNEGILLELNWIALTWGETGATLLLKEGVGPLREMPGSMNCSTACPRFGRAAVPSRRKVSGSPVTVLITQPPATRQVAMWEKSRVSSLLQRATTAVVLPGHGSGKQEGSTSSRTFRGAHCISTRHFSSPSDTVWRTRPGTVHRRPAGPRNIASTVLSRSTAGRLSGTACLLQLPEPAPCRARGSQESGSLSPRSLPFHRFSPASTISHLTRPGSLRILRAPAGCGF